MPQVQKLTDKRNKAIDAFLKEFTVEQFKQICKIANESKFLTGQNERKWKADFDFLMRTDKATNILEEKYNNETITEETKKKSYNNYEQRQYNDLNSLYANKGVINK